MKLIQSGWMIVIIGGQPCKGKKQTKNKMQQ